MARALALSGVAVAAAFLRVFVHSMPIAAGPDEAAYGGARAGRRLAKG